MLLVIFYIKISISFCMVLF